MAQFGSGIPEIPGDVDIPLRQSLTALRNEVLRQRGGRTAPDQVTNFKVTPISNGNIVDWTRSNANFYVLYWSKTPNIGDAIVEQLGDVQRWTHNYGQQGVKLYYWIVSASDNGLKSDPLGYKFGTTLAAGTSTVVPSPPPSSSASSIDPTTDRENLDSGGFTRGG